LKYLTRIQSTDDFAVRSIVECQMYVFHDKATIRDKILMRILPKN